MYIFVYNGANQETQTHTRNDWNRTTLGGRTLVDDQEEFTILDDVPPLEIQKTVELIVRRADCRVRWRGAEEGL